MNKNYKKCKNKQQNQILIKSILNEIIYLYCKFNYLINLKRFIYIHKIKKNLYTKKYI